MTRDRMRVTEREPMRRMPWGLMLCTLLLGVALASCDGPNRGASTQPSSASGFNLDVVASPNVVRGATSGSTTTVGGCALVQAKLSNTKGELIDGVTVNFATTLGGFTDTVTTAAGLLPSAAGVVTTTRGTATVTFCAGDVRGTATITASAEDAFDSVLITIF